MEIQWKINNIRKMSIKEISKHSQNSQNLIFVYWCFYSTVFKSTIEHTEFGKWLKLFSLDSRLVAMLCLQGLYFEGKTKA